MSAFSPSRTRSAALGGSALLRVMSMIELAVQRRRSRLALMELNDEQLKDIGVSRSEAYREFKRPFWG